MFSGGRERYIGMEEVNVELFQKTLVHFKENIMFFPLVILRNPCHEAVSNRNSHQRCS